MSTNAIFFSYSRDNSEFVLKLAKELREAGAKVWLDQLDIKPGTRWDKSIETALGKSSTLLVVLSKSSVASHNVMDEVSYALEEGKTVVPILFEECEIPFRLRRLQFSDFTTSHAAGITTLTSALNLDAEVSSKLAQDTPASGSSEAPKPATPIKPEPPKPTSPEPVAAAAPIAQAKETAQSVTAKTDTAKASKSKKPLIYGVVAIVAVIAIYAIYSAMSGGGSMDMMAMCKADWEEMETAMTDGKEVNELAALRKHIELYAPCPHENEAMDRISFLKAMGSDTNALTNETNALTNETNEESPNESVATNEPVATNEITEPPVTKTETSSTENTTIEKNNDTQTKPLEVIEEVEKVVLTGLNVMRVDFASGNFVQKSPRSWLETNNGNERHFRLLKRDKNAIYLGDGPDVRLTLDISKSAIFYSDANTAEFELYLITGTSATRN